MARLIDSMLQSRDGDVGTIGRAVVGGGKRVLSDGVRADPEPLEERRGGARVAGPRCAARG